MSLGKDLSVLKPFWRFLVISATFLAKSAWKFVVQNISQRSSKWHKHRVSRQKSKTLSAEVKKRFLAVFRQFLPNFWHDMLKNFRCTTSGQGLSYGIWIMLLGWRLRGDRQQVSVTKKTQAGFSTILAKFLSDPPENLRYTTSDQGFHMAQVLCL